MISKRMLTSVSMLFVYAVLSACGGGGGGGSSGAAPIPVTSSFTRTTILPDEPTGAESGDWSGPFSSNPLGSHYQTTVDAPDIRGSGPLRSLAFRFGAASAVNSCPNVTIKLVHKRGPEGGLAADFASNLATGRGSATTVFGPATLTIPSGAIGDYFTIPLSGDFNYNGVDTLVVDIESDRCTAVTMLDAHNRNTSVVVVLRYATRATATGAGWFSRADMRFTFAGGETQVQMPGVLGISSFPFTTLAGGRKLQLLYYPSEINGSGPITGIALPIAGGAPFPPSPVTAQTHTMTVKLGHSTLSALTSTFADNINSGSPVTMANAVTVQIPAGVPADGYLWLPLPDGTFNYNGTDNLVVEIEASAAAALTWTNVHSDGAAPSRRLFALPGELTGIPDNTVNDIKLRFAGGTLDAITPAAMTGGARDGFPFFGNDGKRQYLYRAAELGTRGTITRIGCRVGLSGIAETGFIYTVALSHSTAPTLGTTFATNLTNPVTVFNGTFDLPAVSAGDWVEIPLTTPFAYNGRDNLVLEIGGTGGTAGGFACAYDNSVASTTLYTGRRLFSATSAAATGSVGNEMIDTRFTLQ